MTKVHDPTEMWTHLLATPLGSLSMTLVAYLIAQIVYAKSGFSPLANPVLISIVILVTLLEASHVAYVTYFQGAQLIHFLLAPATVALALPLYRQWPRLRVAAFPLIGGLVAGSLTAIISAVVTAHMLGASYETVASLAPKSATAPIAMTIASEIGGLPSLTAVLAISAGIFGAVFATTILTFLRITEPEVRGFALGVASHGIGTARAFQVSEQMGAFAGLGMSINGVFTAIVVPLLMPWLTSSLLH